MAKQIKGTSGRRPPVPADSHSEIDVWMGRVMPEVHLLVRRADEMIRETIPGLQFAVKWQKAYYGLPDHGWVIELAAYHVSANLVFHGGADFDDPPPLGDADRSRYIKVRSLEELDQPEVHAWIENAGRVDGWT